MKYEKENLENIVKNSLCFAEVCRKLNIGSRGRNNTIKK